MVAVQEDARPFVIATVQAGTPGSRITTTGVVDSASADTAVIVRGLPRVASMVVVASRNASARTETDWVARCLPFVAETTIRYGPGLA